MKYAGGRWKITRAGTDAATTTIKPDIGLRLGSFQQDFKEVSGQPTSDLTNSFTYNSANQVISLLQSNTDYNYTDANNRTGIYEPNGLNQYKKVDGQEFEHDATGNLKKDRASDGVLTTYSYDMENHLVRVEGPVAGDLTYDALGRLSRLVSGSNSTQFLYDGDALVAEYLNGALHRRYVHGDQVDEPLIEYQGTNLSARRYLHADHQGSIIAHSNANGEVTQKNAYDPYGIPAPSNDGRFGYTGQSWLKELGLNYYKARIYSPRLGRFLQTDPIFYKDDMNLYAYAGGDPVGRIDPSGNAAFAIPFLVGQAGREAGRRVIIGIAIFVGGAILDAGRSKFNEMVRDQAMANESAPPAAGHSDLEDVVTGGADADHETSKGTKIYGDSPTGKTADEVMGEVRGLEGAESTTKEGDRGKVEVVTVPDGSRAIDRPSKAGPRTIEIQNPKGKTTTEVRFPEKTKP